MKTEKALKNTLRNVGNSLAKLRLEKGYQSVRAFASKYDLPEIHYWRMEHGKTNITLKSLTRILQIHKLSLQEFFCQVSTNV